MLDNENMPGELSSLNFEALEGKLDESVEAQDIGSVKGIEEEIIERASVPDADKMDFVMEHSPLEKRKEMMQALMNKAWESTSMPEAGREHYAPQKLAANEKFDFSGIEAPAEKNKYGATPACIRFKQVLDATGKPTGEILFGAKLFNGEDSTIAFALVTKSGDGKYVFNKDAGYAFTRESRLENINAGRYETSAARALGELTTGRVTKRQLSTNMRKHGLTEKHFEQRDRKIAVSAEGREAREMLEEARTNEQLNMRAQKYEEMTKRITEVVETTERERIARLEKEHHINNLNTLRLREERNYRMETDPEKKEELFSLLQETIYPTMEYLGHKHAPKYKEYNRLEHIVSENLAQLKHETDPELRNEIVEELTGVAFPAMASLGLSREYMTDEYRRLIEEDEAKYEKFVGQSASRNYIRGAWRDKLKLFDDEVLSDEAKPTTLFNMANVLVPAYEEMGEGQKAEVMKQILQIEFDEYDITFPDVPEDSGDKYTLAFFTQEVEDSENAIKLPGAPLDYLQQRMREELLPALEALESAEAASLAQRIRDLI